MSALRFDSRRTRRLWVLGLTMTALAIFAVVFVAASSADNPSGCDFAANGTTQSCSSPLTGSTFAGGDGNLLASPATFGSTDWQNVAGLNAGFDLSSGTGDNSFGQGTKEDNPAVTVVSGSIPPNKSDLTRFYEASAVGTNSHNFLYLGWERSNVLGSANMDFEINQSATPGLGTAGPHTINRTAGDLLVTFDFTNGGGTPTLGLLFWVTSGSTSQCFSSNSLPCWGNHVTLNGSDSIGAVNNLGAVTDPLFPNSPNYINPVPALQFGETSVDLTAAGVFPAGTCKAFGSTFLKSRASASFGSEVKDFVAPIPVNVSNCGAIKIIKHTSPRGLGQSFSYASNLPAEPAGTVGGVPQGGVACPGNSGSGVQSDGSFCLNDSGNSTSDSAGNTIYNNALQSGTYTVTEGADPSGFQFQSVTCTGGTTSTSGKTATITLAPDDIVTCTYVNQQLTGAIKITKTSSKTAATPLAGAKFAIKDPNGNALPGSPFTTNSSGVVCVEGLTTLGNYSVQEVSAPTGYAVDDSSVHTVGVTGSQAKCTDSPFGGQSLTFTDTPLTDIGATATSEVAGGTQSTITCTGTSTDGVTNLNSSDGPKGSASVSATGVHPGTYTCTIVVDP
jgi:prealbumin domain-containing protein